MVGNETLANTAPLAKRVIKRYSNRKLYDTEASRYVTLLQIADMVRAGEDVQVIDKVTREDKTDVTLALIISEELRTSPRGISLGTLRGLIRRHSEREVPLSVAEKSMSIVSLQEGVETALKGDDLAPESGERHPTLGRWQEAVDERIRTVVPRCSEVADLRGEVQRMAERVAELERDLQRAKMSQRE